jgi:phospholipid/cholesterol/gamma-HCH transport system substrate-binding protein
METRAHHVLIGLFTILVALAALLFCLWLTKSGATATSTTTSDLQRGGQRPVAGSPVQYSGIKVGDVVGLSLDPADPRKVRARIRVTGRRHQGRHRRQAGPGRHHRYRLIQLTNGSPQSPRWSGRQ